MALPTLRFGGGERRFDSCSREAPHCWCTIAPSGRAEAMPIFDAQVHAYERNHPGRPWVGTLHGPAEVTGDQMVAAMDAVGVDGRCWSRRSACTATTPATPRRSTRRIPAGSGWSSRSIRPIPRWPIRSPTGRRPRHGRHPGFLRDDVSTDPADPDINRALAAAARHSLPVNLACSGRLEQAGQLAARNPNTRLVIDHLACRNRTSRHLPRSHSPICQSCWPWRPTTTSQ